MCDIKVQFNVENSEFELLDETGKSTNTPVAYGFQWTPIPSNEAVFLQLWSSALPEAQVIQLVTNDDKTVGWLCTVSALTSKAHEYSTSLHFRAAAGHAVQLLLETEAVQRVLLKQERPSIDIYPSGACVLIAKKNLLSKEILSNPLGLLPMLHRYSFSPYNFEKKQVRTAGKFASANLFKDNKGIKKIKLRMISNAVPFINFINTLLAEPLSVEQDSAYTFFLYYQIIELLMEEVQRQKTLQFASDIQKSAEDATQLYELMLKLREHTSELGRILSLVHSFTKIEPQELDGLKIECLNLLIKLNRARDINSCGNALYAVRNMLIHNMRRISADALIIMPLINEYLEVVVPNMLLTFVASSPAKSTSTP